MPVDMPQRFPPLKALFLAGSAAAYWGFRSDVAAGIALRTAFLSGAVWLAWPEMTQRSLRNVAHGSGRIAPTPCVAQPKCGQQMAGGRLRAPVGDVDRDQQIVLRRLGILDHGYLCPQPGPDRAEFQANDAASNHNHGFRHAFQAQGA